MKLRIGACALVLALAGCSGESPDSGVAGMRGVAASKATGKLPMALPLARAIGASIANAPDRGALLSYPNKATPAKQEGAYTWYPTSISEAHAFKGIADGEMTVPAPDGSQVKLRYERHVEEIDGNWTWIGRVVGGDQMQEAIITFGEKAVFGSIPQANGKPALSLQTRNGTVFAVQTDPSKVVSATKGHVDVMVPEAAALRSSMGAAVSQSAQVSQGATAVAQGAPQTAANTIDVAIGYTPEFATANGGASGAATRLIYLIQVGNQAFVNSDINGYLRIVNAVQVSYTNTNTNQTALSELTGSNGQSAVTVPASLAPLRTARDQYGADIAVLVRKFNTPENEGCGIAWLNGANQTAITAADASWGYAVISDGYDQGTDGKTYYCADETLVHEAAHLMGSAHDRANSLNSSNGLLYGRYPYSFGYKTAANAGNFYTVMAYGDTGQLAHRIFSTPLKSTCGASANLACGVANSEDNARSLNQTIPIVAQFRATIVPFTGGLKNDANGDGRSDLFWHSTTAQYQQTWLMNGTSWSYGTANAVSSAYRVGGVGDFNGDGLADVLWYDQAKTSLYAWLSGSTGQYSIVFLRSYPAGWDIAGIEDANGDGRSDIFWHNPTAGALEYWLMNGSAWTYGGARSISNIYRVSAIADINGDSYADIVWRDSGNTQLWAWMGSSTGVFAAPVLLRSYPQGWQVVGAADVNNDGRDDLFWHNATTGSLEYWLMNGTTWTYGGARPVPTKYVVAALGDYNGDGYADVIWRDNAKTELWIWQGQQSGVFTSIQLPFPGGYPAGWDIVK
ncbi:FG-GAP-like repeat-containing protein [Pseudoxanthomonas sp. LjRoot125]|uniref:FG-GAP-like repeat-containing protein n=1 Tax=Pseudoxanthomonas sp. LjRoot125 TaxID=3342258 RepID=UPI003E116B5A